MTSHRFITRTLTTGLVGAAIAASSATARPPLDPITTVSHVGSKAQSTGDNGFDWGDAAIGAGAAGGLMIVSIGGFGLVEGRLRLAR